MNKLHQWNAEDYAGNSAGQLQWALELIPKLALQGTESVLDIGCGDGKVTVELARATSGRVVGVDLSRDMVRRAARQFPLAGHPNLSFFQMDATALEFGEVFDVAFSNAALHWVEDQVAVLRGLRRCLSTGGRLLFQMGGLGNAREITRVVEAVSLRARWRAAFEGFRSPHHYRGPEQYCGWLVETGFEPCRAELLPKDMLHCGAEGLRGWLRTTWFPFTDRVPGELRDAYLDEIVDTYLAEYPIDDKGQVHVAMVRLEVEAVAV